jgi:protein phosphatase
LLIVADGVSTARVGNGERASHIGCEHLRNSLLRATDLSDLQTVFTTAFFEASSAIIDVALREYELPPDVRDRDVMSTRALVGILEGGRITLANVGDSRAYLVSGGVAEQLTVDGDVGSVLLAAGTPPEQICEMGADAKTLRSCLGACCQNESGALVCDPSRAVPQVTRWNLLPGDVVILCSDGLVDEGVFLEPSDLARLVFDNQKLSAQALAERLVAEANALQRVPSVSEPNGFGDNITCVVIKRLSP